MGAVGVLYETVSCESLSSLFGAFNHLLCFAFLLFIASFSPVRKQESASLDFPVMHEIKIEINSF